MDTTTKRKAILWGRFSSDGQADGDSRSRQERRNRECAVKFNLEIIAEYFDEATSVKTGTTPLFKKVLSTLPKGAGIVCEDLDRINRGHSWRAKAALLDIIEDGHFVITSTDNVEYNEATIQQANTLLVGDMKTTLAFTENQKRISRIREEMEASIEMARKGIATSLGGWMPRHIGFSKETGKYYIKEDIRSIIERIFNMYLDGNGLAHIATELNKANIPTSKEKKNGGWNGTTIANILRNVGFIGTLKFRDEYIKGVFPPAIPEDLFYRVQAKLNQNKTKRGKYSGNVLNIFRGLMKCACCGKGINVKHHTSGIRYYFCTRGAFKGCEATKMVPSKYPENALVHTLVPLMRKQLLGEDKSQEQLATLEGRKAAIEGRISETMALWDKGLTMAAVEERLTKLKAELESTIAAIETIKSTSATTANLPEQVAALEKLAEKSLDDDGIRRKIANLMPVMVSTIQVEMRNKGSISFDITFTNGTKGNAYISTDVIANFLKRHPKQ